MVGLLNIICVTEIPNGLTNYNCTCEKIIPCVNNLVQYYEK